MENTILLSGKEVAKGIIESFFNRKDEKLISERKKASGIDMDTVAMDINRKCNMNKYLRVKVRWWDDSEDYIIVMHKENDICEYYTFKGMRDESSTTEWGTSHTRRVPQYELVTGSWKYFVNNELLKFFGYGQLQETVDWISNS